MQAAHRIRGRGGEGLGEPAAGEAPNLQELEEEIENGNLIQKHKQQAVLNTLLFKSMLCGQSRLSSHQPCWNFVLVTVAVGVAKGSYPCCLYSYDEGTVHTLGD